MKKYFLFTILVLTAAASVSGQVSGNSQYQDAQPQLSRNAAANATIPSSDEIVLEINGILNAAPDSYVAIFHVVQVGEKADETDGLMRDRINGFTESIATLSGDSIVITRDVLSFVPRYDYHWASKKFTRWNNEEPDGYEMQVNLHVSYKHAETLERIVTAAARQDIVDLASVNYFIRNQEKYQDALRARCIKAMRSKFKTFDALGIKRDSMNVSFADKFYTTYPDTRYDAYKSLTRPSLYAARKQETSSSIKGGSDVNKPLTRFYTPVNYDSYDVVIHPEVNGPVIQFSYSLEVRYGRAGKKNIVVLTPQGDLKPLPLN